MTLQTAEVALWCAGVALMSAIALAVYEARFTAQLRIHVADLEEAREARDTALDHLLAEGLPAVVASMRRPDASVSSFSVAGCLQGSEFMQNLRILAERYAADLRQVQANAEVATRRRVEEEAHETTQTTVRSIATTVVNLGTNLSKVVTEALRQHHGDETFATLTKIDHTVQQMIRQAQSYLVVCGSLPGRQWPTQWPAQSLTDVLHGAMGRIQDCPRVQAREFDRTVISPAVEPAAHPRPARDLDLAALVVTANAPRQGLNPEQCRVMELCSQHGALSLAEIGAHLDLPSSVITIVVSGLMDTGHLATPAPTPAADVPDVALLKEVLIGLRKLPI